MESTDGASTLTANLFHFGFALKFQEIIISQVFSVDGIWPAVSGQTKMLEFD